MDDLDALYKELGRRVRTAREAQPMTQEALASEVSLTRASIANIERGRQRIYVHTLIELATAFKMDPAALLPEGRTELDEKVAAATAELPLTREWMRRSLAQLKEEE